MRTLKNKIVGLLLLIIGFAVLAIEGDGTLTLFTTPAAAMLFLAKRNVIG